MSRFTTTTAPAQELVTDTHLDNDHLPYLSRPIRILDNTSCRREADEADAADIGVHRSDVLALYGGPLTAHRVRHGYKDMNIALWAKVSRPVGYTERIARQISPGHRRPLWAKTTMLTLDSMMVIGLLASAGVMVMSEIHETYGIGIILSTILLAVGTYTMLYSDEISEPIKRRTDHDDTKAVLEALNYLDEDITVLDVNKHRGLSKLSRRLAVAQIHLDSTQTYDTSLHAQLAQAWFDYEELTAALISFSTVTSTQVRVSQDHLIDKAVYAIGVRLDDIETQLSKAETERYIAEQTRKDTQELVREQLDATISDIAQQRLIDQLDLDSVELPEQPAEIKAEAQAQAEIDTKTEKAPQTPAVRWPESEPTKRAASAYGPEDATRDSQVLRELTRLATFSHDSTTTERISRYLAAGYTPTQVLAALRR